MPNITINTEHLTESERLRLRVLRCKERMRAIGISSLKPIYEFRHGKVDPYFSNTYSARVPNSKVVKRLEAIVEGIEAGEIKKAIHQPGDVSFGREAQKEAS